MSARRYWTNWRYQGCCALTTAVAVGSIFLAHNRHDGWALLCLIVALAAAEMIGQKFRLAYDDGNAGNRAEVHE